MSDPTNNRFYRELPREDEPVSQSRFAKHYPASWGVRPFVPNPLFTTMPPKTLHDIVEEFGARTLAEARAAKAVAKARRKVKGERVSPGVKIGAANREAVRAYFAAHLGCTNVECAQALGLSVMSVGRHVATIRKEWE